MSTVHKTKSETSIKKRKYPDPDELIENSKLVPLRRNNYQELCWKWFIGYNKISQEHEILRQKYEQLKEKELAMEERIEELGEKVERKNEKINKMKLTLKTMRSSKEQIERITMMRSYHPYKQFPKKCQSETKSPSRQSPITPFN